MSHIQQKALYATAAIALSLGAHGIAFADPLAADSANVASAGSDGQCNVESLPCVGASHAHKPLAFHGARLHSVSKQRPASTVVVAYNWGANPQSSLSCKGEGSWSLLCPGASVIGVSY